MPDYDTGSKPATFQQFHMSVFWLMSHNSHQLRSEHRLFGPRNVRVMGPLLDNLLELQVRNCLVTPENIKSVASPEDLLAYYKSLSSAYMSFVELILSPDFQNLATITTASHLFSPQSLLAKMDEEPELHDALDFLGGQLEIYQASLKEAKLEPNTLQMLIELPSGEVIVRPQNQVLMTLGTIDRSLASLDEISTEILLEVAYA